MPTLHPTGTQGPSWSSRAPWRTGEACLHCLHCLFISPLSLLVPAYYHLPPWTEILWNKAFGLPRPITSLRLPSQPHAPRRALSYCPAQPRAGRSPWTLVRTMNSWPVPGTVRRYYPFHTPWGLQEFRPLGPIQTAALPGDSQPTLFCAFLF